MTASKRSIPLYLILFGILVLLLLLCYYLIEVKELGKKSFNEEKLKLISKEAHHDTSDIVAIEWNNHLIKRDPNNHAAPFINATSRKNKHPIPEKAVKELFDRLGALEVVRVFSTKEIKNIESSASDFFPSSSNNYFALHFKDEVVRVHMGKRLDYDDSFYLKITRKIHQEASSESFFVIARDTTSYTGAYSSKDELQNQNYRWWQNWQQKSPSELVIQQ
ncbi:MAG: hypothetical protein HQK50_05095 [Oligoflexia bacterium]|nr:hypothetical protein [Oligoflexia bacterium]MBF0364924.1 hypothetical protein [Oligoflexia bacterium]